jgi:hypothetical protein
VRRRLKSAVNATARYLTAAMAIAAWIAVSNHCTFAAVAPRPQSANACPFHSKPAKQHAPAAPTQCCKILRAITPAPAKIPARVVVDLANVQVGCAQPIFLPLPPIYSSTGCFLDTGPPGTTSFLELIGSLQAHAPPLFA